MSGGIGRFAGSSERMKVLTSLLPEGGDTGGVTAYIHTASGLLKATWSSRDYSAMKWRGCTIHAVHIGEYEDNRVQFLDDGTVDTEFDDLDDTVGWHFLLLDIDYIVSRFEPETPGQEPAYWIAPATLAFADASGVTATISDGSSGPVLLGPGITATNLVMSDVLRIGPEGEPQWRITGKGFDIQLRDSGFRLYIRAAPQLVACPSLELAARGGVSFAQRSFAA